LYLLVSEPHTDVYEASVAVQLGQYQTGRTRSFIEDSTALAYELNEKYSGPARESLVGITSFSASAPGSGPRRSESGLLVLKARGTAADVLEGFLTSAASQLVDELNERQTSLVAYERKMVDTLKGLSESLGQKLAEMTSASEKGELAHQEEAPLYLEETKIIEAIAGYELRRYELEQDIRYTDYHPSRMISQGIKARKVKAMSSLDKLFFVILASLLLGLIAAVSMEFARTR
jgi:hypothetical protein